MNWNEWLPLLVIISSLVPGLIIFALPEEKIRLRTTLNITPGIVTRSGFSVTRRAVSINFCHTINSTLAGDNRLCYRLSRTLTTPQPVFWFFQSLRNIYSWCCTIWQYDYVFTFL